MSKVFEALERQQKNTTQENGRDPLTAESGALDDISAVPENEAAFILPSVIGAPTGPRSNEGMIFPSLNTTMCEGVAGESALPPMETRANGKVTDNAAGSNARVSAHVAAGGSVPPGLAHDPILDPRSPGYVSPAARAPREIPVEQIKLTALHPRLILMTAPDASECEQYRTLRTQLFHAAEKKTMQVVVVTSALAGEGKTSTALNLALAIAQSKEKRVLVVDGDLRRPSVATYLGLQPKSGLEEVLQGAGQPLDSILCLDAHELYVLPVRRESSNPTELLSSERLAMTIEELREYFDFILVDSPPVMPFADARLLANHSDSVVFVVRSGAAPYETVEKAIDVFPQGRILGVVLNSAEHLGSADYYDYYESYARRDDRRRSLWQKLKGRLGATPFAKRMDLR